MDFNKIMYYVFHLLGFIAVTVFGMIYSKKFKLPFWRVGLFVVCTYLTGYLFMYFQCWVETGFKEWGGNNIVRTFIWIPLLALPYAKLFKIDLKLSSVILAPMLCVIHGVSHFGCIFEGCCYGYPSDFGIWNPVLKKTLFPTQIIEALVAIAIVIIVVKYTHNNEYSRDTKAYPFMLMLFGGTRFFLEFLRDNEKLFWGISSLAIHAFVMFVVGTLWFFLPWTKWIENFKRKKSKQQIDEQEKNDE